MFLAFQVATVMLSAIAMSLAVAHALELPGKMRLDKETYLSVQTIYYPGFTFGGFSEGLAMLATLVLLLMTPTSVIRFWLTLIAVCGFIGMQVVYWAVTHPVNKFWLKNKQLSGAGKQLFASDPLRRGEAGDEGHETWQELRDRWEYSHVARAILALVALIALVIAVAL